MAAFSLISVLILLLIFEDQEPEEQYVLKRKDQPGVKVGE